ncbi:hypothetical protein BSZ37_04755 [Rubrivirga marina]|uniref:Peptidase C-terminal archaeal/bacterial domain-containing protein n=1 Tax=Rubrivirga marina TaxID=1196024 RepID=A0A271IZ76_9BACT|nr:hypothetical protein BSZ37_04755 [Rubrivirga marina]
MTAVPEFHRLDADADARFLRARVADPLTRTPFRPTNEVVMCDACGTVSLRETWEALGGCPNGHRRAAAWDVSAALSAGDGAATAAPRPPARGAARPAPPPEEPKGRWLTWLLVAVGVAGLVVLGIVVVGMLRDGNDTTVVETDDTPAGPTGPQAIVIAEPSLVEGSLAEGDYQTPDGRYQDLYTFAADSSGAVLAFRASSEDFFPDLVVETPEGDRVEAETLSDDPDTGARVVAVTGLRGPGLYRILIAARRPGETGDYAFRIVSENPVRPLTPNGSAVQAELGKFSERVEGFFRDRYRFTGAAGREHTVTVRSSAFAPVVQMEGPGGAVSGETGRAGGVVTFVFTPQRDGTHTLVVTSQSAGKTGAYTVQLAVEAAEEPEQVVTRTLPTNGQAVTDSLQAGDTQTYSIRGRVGDRVRLEVRAEGFTPSLTLVGPDGERTPASPDGDRARLRLTLPSAGTYRVIVGATDGSGVARTTLEQEAAVTSEDIPRLPGADALGRETPPPPANDDENYRPQPIDNAPDGGRR